MFCVIIVLFVVGFEVDLKLKVNVRGYECVRLTAAAATGGAAAQ